MKTRTYLSNLLLIAISFCFSLATQNTQAQPINNLPCDAIAIECGVGVTSSNVDATDSAIGNPTCAFGSQRDLFYSFTAIPGYSYSITVNGLDYDAVLALYTGTCAALVPFDCSDSGLSDNIAETIDFAHAIDSEPQTFFIRTYDFNVSGGGFSLMVSCTAPNDNPCDATLVDCNTTVLGSTGGATNSALGDFSCASANINDLFFKFNTQPNFTYTITVNGDNYDGVLGLYTGGCTSLTEFSCADDLVISGGAESLSYESSFSQTVYIRTTDWLTNGGDFELSIECTSANQMPCEALQIACGETLNGSTYGGTQSVLELPSCGTGTPSDVFYEFEAYPGNTYEVIVNGEDYDAILAAYSGPCDGPYEELACADNAVGSGLQEQILITVDEISTVLIRTYDWYLSEGEFEITLNCLVDNDIQCDATPIACGETLYGGTTGATPSGIAPPSCASSENSDVFYTFEGIAGYEYTATVNGDNYDGVLIAYSGVCDGALTELACADMGTSSGVEETITFSLDESATILLRTMDWSVTGGEFEINLSCAPGYDEPCTALPITCGETLSGSNTFATSSELDAPSCAAGSQQDVFYTFSAIPGYEYQVTINGEDYDGVLVAYTGFCGGSLTEIACADNGGTSGVEEQITFSVENTSTITIRTYDWFSSQGSFDITLNCTELPDCPLLGLDIGDSCDDGNPDTVNDTVNEECICQGTFPAPANDLCINATSLTVNNPGECPANQVIGTTIGASHDGGEFSCDDGGEWVDVYYTFNSGDFNTVRIDLEFITQSDIVIEVLTSCTGSSILCEFAISFLEFTVTPNTDYIVRTGPNLAFSSPGTFGICVSGIFDCPILEANIGDSCNDGDPSTINDEVQADCTCAGEITGDATFSGTTDWGVGCTFRPMAIGLYEAGTDIHVATISFNINSAGTFSIPMDFLGTFDVYIKIDGYLRKGFYNYVMSVGENTIDVGELTPGELNGDDGVNIADVSVVNASFGSVIGDANYNLLADMNCDGGVNIVDVSILNANFGLVGVLLP